MMSGTQGTDSADLSPLSRHGLPAAAAALVLAALYVSSRNNYLLFHTLIELFSVIVLLVIFLLAWNTRRVQENRYLLFIGVASFFTASLQLVHALAYKGMGVFPGNDANMATQLWIAVRYLFSLTFLAAPLFITRRLNVSAAFTGYAVITGLIFWTIFNGSFPACFVEGRGLTPFKIYSEYAIIVIFLAAAGMFVWKRKAVDPKVLRLILLSIAGSAAAELAFTRYISVYGSANLAGHFLLFASMVFVYRAIIVTGIIEPSNLLFRNLKLSEEALRVSEEKYRSLFVNMIDGFAYHRVITDEHGKPVDYVFLEVNNAFERLTGLKREAIIGRPVRAVLPGIESDPADWIGIYGKVALTGEGIRFEQHAMPLDRWFSVSAYSPMKEHFVAVFEDITDRKRMEIALQESREQLER
ncbi:MAG TPA: MASE3 domain-containing protein, partial [Nitrospirota bacterium]|nr:MASE3 domain-containing protein [Nitrospirota bacterium]